MAHAISKLKRHQNYLHVLCKCPHKIRKVILRNASDDLIKTVCECAYNLLRGIPRLSTKQKTSLRPYRDICHKLSSPNKSLSNKRRELVQQQGSGLFSAILLPILSALPWLLKK